MAQMVHKPRTCDAFISACENARDDNQADTITLTTLDEWAELYVKEGLSTCECVPKEEPKYDATMDPCSPEFDIDSWN